MGPNAAYRRASLCVICLAMLAACQPGAEVTRRAGSPAGLAATPGEEAREVSGVIAALRARSSVLPPGGDLARVAELVLASYAGAEATQLRVARLKAEARSQNWIPQIGPSLSLSALSGLAAGLSLQHGIWDNGRRKAERDLAGADVDLAAIALSTEANGRIHDGLRAYLEARRAEARAEVSSAALGRLQRYAGMMSERVAGGVSDRAEQSALQQRLDEMQATLAADRQEASNARAALAALIGGADGSVAAAGGAEPAVLAVPGPDGGHLALSVMRARAEGERTLAEARLGRAGLLPGLNGTVAVTTRGIDPGVNLGGQFGAGRQAELAALEAMPDLVAKLGQSAEEKAQRRRVELQSQIAALQGRQAQGAAVLGQSAANLQLFTDQYELGRRSLSDIAAQHDLHARMQRDQVSIGFDILILQLEQARDLGLLVEGARL